MERLGLDELICQKYDVIVEVSRWHCRKFILSRQDVEDMIQDVFLKICEKSHDWPWHSMTDENINGFLANFAKWTILSVMKKNIRRKTLAPEIGIVCETAGESDRVGVIDEILTMDDFLRTMSPSDKKVLELKLAGMSAGEIANEIGKASAHVRARVHAMKKRYQRYTSPVDRQSDISQCERDEKIKQLRAAGLRCSEIAKRINLNENNVRARITEHAKAKRSGNDALYVSDDFKKYLSKERDIIQNIFRLRARGLTASEIAGQVGVSKQLVGETIYRTRKKYFAPPAILGKPDALFATEGFKNHGRVLIPRHREIASLRAQGETCGDIAKRLGYTRKTVYGIVCKMKKNYKSLGNNEAI